MKPQFLFNFPVEGFYSGCYVDPDKIVYGDLLFGVYRNGETAVDGPFKVVSMEFNGTVSQFIAFGVVNLMGIVLDFDSVRGERPMKLLKYQESDFINF